MRCPICNKFTKTVDLINSKIIHCKSCDKMYVMPAKSLQAWEDNREEIPDIEDLIEMTKDFEVGNQVICIDESNPYYMKTGFVEKIDFLYIRVVFEKHVLWMNCETLAKIVEE